jgi:hypothetical protein
MKLEFSRHVFGKYSNIFFYEHPSSGSEFSHAGRRTTMTKPILAFRNFINTFKNEKIIKSNSRLRAPLHNFDKSCFPWNPVETNNVQYPLYYTTRRLYQSQLHLVRFKKFITKCTLFLSLESVLNSSHFSIYVCSSGIVFFKGLIYCSKLYKCLHEFCH